MRIRCLEGLALRRLGSGCGARPAVTICRSSRQPLRRNLLRPAHPLKLRNALTMVQLIRRSLWCLGTWASPSGGTNPLIRPVLKRRQASAAFSSHRAAVFQAISSTRAIAEMLTPSALRATQWPRQSCAERISKRRARRFPSWSTTVTRCGPGVMSSACWWNVVVLPR